MAKRNLNAALQKRATEAASSQANAEALVNEVYDGIFGGATVPRQERETRLLPADRLRHFFTAKIGFRPYSPADLAELAEDIRINGLLERGIARPIPDSREYEVLSGNSRMDACLRLGWTEIPFEVEHCDDNRAIVIATVTNLKRRQKLLPSERGWAYRALLEAQRAQGKRNDLTDGTSVEIQQKTTTREQVAAFFGVKPHEIQRDIRLTYLIDPLLEAVDERRLKVSCGVKLADYNEDAQQLFYQHWTQSGELLTPKLLNYIRKCCPPPTLSEAALSAAWQEAQEQWKERIPMVNFSLSLERSAVAPLLETLGGEAALQALFLEFLQAKVSEPILEGRTP